MTKSRGILRPRRPWLAWELEALRRFYPGWRTDWIAKALGRELHTVYGKSKRMGLAKTEAYLASPDACRLRRGDQVGAAYRYPKGHVPANKGKRGMPSRGRSAETQFKKGQVGHNRMPVGTVNTDNGGYVKVKLREPNVWGYMAQLVWASTHPWPLSEGMVIRYVDGDRGNCDPSNLTLASRADLAAANQIHRYPEEIKQLIYAKRSLTRKINDHEKNRRRPRGPVRADGQAGHLDEPRGRDRAIESDG